MSASTKPVDAPAAQEVRQIPIGQLFPSEFNPRKTIDPSFLAQLADSIQQIGVQVPLLVRLIGADDGIDGNDVPVDMYGIIAGHRRFAAAQKLGMETLPCIVRDMTDSEALQVMIVENLQRADLSPMEEADGYRVLIRAMGDPDPQVCLEEIARKSGKPAGYVRSRLKLLGLIAPAQEALREQLITFDAALLIAKLEPSDQERATTRALNYHVASHTAQEALEGVRKELADEKQWRAEHPEEEEESAYEPVPSARLKAWIAENILLDLANALWPLDDAGILPEAGACTTCPKRAGSDQALFADLTAKQDVCTDPACFDAKKKAFVEIQKSAAKASGKPLVKISSAVSQAPIKEGSELEKTTFKSGQWVAAKKGECAGTYQGVTSEGELRWVCVDQKCKVHKHTIQQPASRGAQVNAAEQQRLREDAEKRRKLIAETEGGIREKIWSAILGQLDASKALRLVAGDSPVAAAQRKKLLAAFPTVNGLTLEALTVFWFQFFDRAVGVNDYWMAQNLAGVQGDRESLWGLAKAAGVNADAMAAQHFHAAFTDAGSVKTFGLEDLYPKGVPWPKVPPSKSSPKSPAKKPTAKKPTSSPARKKAAKKAAKKRGAR